MTKVCDCDAGVYGVWMCVYMRNCCSVTPPMAIPTAVRPGSASPMAQPVMVMRGSAGHMGQPVMVMRGSAGPMAQPMIVMRGSAGPMAQPVRYLSLPLLSFPQLSRDNSFISIVEVSC